MVRRACEAWCERGKGRPSKSCDGALGREKWKSFFRFSKIWKEGLGDFGVLEKFFEGGAAGADQEGGGLGVFLFEGGKAGNLPGASAFDFDGVQAGAFGEDEVDFERAVAPVVEGGAG